MDKNNEARHRGLSVGSAFANFPKYSSTFKRSHSTTTGLAPRSIRIVVLGIGGVGKTAMTVRFVTKRFIGDYDPNLETIYRHTTMVDEQIVNFEIMDTAGQNENSLQLEDKCKWGESFIFIYDVTDRYSFDELTRLKFIASYTHSRLRVNFTPCWILIGNKADLADRERMVSTKEGESLARDLGCHIFREISVKESRVESSLVFEDLWRYFVRLNPRSPSSSQRRKYSLRIQDRISVIDSTSCASQSTEYIADTTHDHKNMNEILVRTITSTIRRQAPSNLLPGIKYKQAKHFLKEDQRYISTSSISSRIPENIEEDENEDKTSLDSFSIPRQRSRRNALVNGNHLTVQTRHSFRSKPSKNDRLTQLRTEPTFNNISSAQNTSLDCLSSLPDMSEDASSEKIVRNRSNSDTSVLSRQPNGNIDSSNYLRPNPERFRRASPRRFNKARLTNSFRHNIKPPGSSLASTCEVSGS